MERLQRVMAARGSGSRRDAEALIVAGRVTVDGQRVTELGTKVDPQRAKIRVDGRELRAQRDRTLILHKPAGYITTVKDERDRWTVMDLVDVRERVYPVGRLDRDTEGLLILTNNGELANRIMHPRYRLTKEYHVLTTIRPDDRTMRRVREGVLVDGQVIRPDEFRLLRESRDGIWLTISLHLGMYHVIRRMMEAVKIPVERLTRVRVGPLALEGIAKGTWRDLTPGEAASLAEAVHLDEPAPPVSHAVRTRPRPLPVTRPEGRTTVMPVAPNRPAPERTFGLRPKARPAFTQDHSVHLIGEGPRDGRPRTDQSPGGGHGTAMGRDGRPAAASGPRRGGRFAATPPENAGEPRDSRGQGGRRFPAGTVPDGPRPSRFAGVAPRGGEDARSRQERDHVSGRDRFDAPQTTSGRRSRGITPDRRSGSDAANEDDRPTDDRVRRGRDDSLRTERDGRPPKGFPSGGRRAGRMARPDRMGRPDPSGRRGGKANRSSADPRSLPPSRPGEPRPGHRGGRPPAIGQGTEHDAPRPTRAGRRPDAPKRGKGGPPVNRRDRSGPRFTPRSGRGDRMTPRDDERQEQREHDRHEP